MLGYDKYRSLHTIVLLKDVIRKWWKVELAFTDKSGYVLDHAKGEVTPPQNDICRLSLFSKEGFKRCNASIRVVNDKFKSSPKLRGTIAHECHMGFTIVGAPVHLNGDYEGSIFCCGVAREPPSELVRLRLKDRITTLNPQATEVERAVERIPVMPPAEVERLFDLMQFAANEIAAFDADAQKKDAEDRRIGAELGERYKFENIVGKSGPMLAIFRLLEKVCDSDSTVLIQGDSGTGKELVARAIHYNGPRKNGPFVAQNCSAFNDNLLESALFGHVKGAFTGAVKDKKGLFEVADGGTFFLDEIGDMSPALQVKVMRVIQDGVFTPVGASAPRQVDVRVIAATHKDLADLVNRGEFREDLYYRINVIRVQVPPLRERRDDIPVLVEHFLEKHARGAGRRELAPETLRLLEGYAWPGNIRELENEIERLLVLAPAEGPIGPEHVSSRLRETVGDAPGPGVVAAAGRLKNAVEALEREMIHQGLVRTHWNKSRLSRELGISRSNLILKIERYGLEDRGGD